MTNGLTRTILTALLGSSLVLSTTPVLADDDDDVMAVIQRYAELEGDLDAQGELIRDDRVQIATTRWMENAAYMNWQAIGRAHRDKVNGGPSGWIVEIESPEVRVFGDAAVVSLIRRQLVLPPDSAPVNATPLYQTIVLIKERGQWRIAHTHVSPVGPWN